MNLLRAGCSISLCAAVLFGACGGPPTTPSGQNANGALGIAGADTSLPHVLIDASRDGGVWWFPQVAPFSAEAGHQGKALADHMRGLGYFVEELPRPFVMTTELLGEYDIVVRANHFGAYNDGEVAAYVGYVQRGGSLLLLADHGTYAPPDEIAPAFGIELAGTTRGDNILDTFEAHDVTSGVDPLPYLVGSGIVTLPAGAQILGRLSAQSYLDLNRNGMQDTGEPNAPGVLGVMPFGSGRIVFSGDVNMWETLPQPLVANVLAWLLRE
jgi:hypothetical protein